MLAAPFAAGAQTPASDPEVAALLRQLYAYARHYRDTLPSLSCDESITSQSVKNGKVRKEVRIESSLRETRADPSAANPFEERHQFKSIDGKPPKPHVNIPYFVEGGFANAVGFTKEESAGCYTYQLSHEPDGVRRLELTALPERGIVACDDVIKTYRKTVLIDAEGRITHVERSMSPEDAHNRREVDFAAMDYGPQPLGDETVWLPTRMTSHDANDQGRMTAVYSNYHRYTATSKVLSAAPPTEN